MEHYRQVGLLTMGITLLVILIILLFKAPKASKVRLMSTNQLDPTINKLLKMFGGDIESLLPEGSINRRVKSTGLERLFKVSDNPWKVTYSDFIILQFVLMFIGGLVGAGLLALFILLDLAILGAILLFVMPLLGWMHPLLTYREVAKKREAAFKSQLPEMIDLLVMALSGGGYSLPVAFAEILPYMRPSVMKDEVTRIVNDLDSGHSMESSLARFADRSPTEGIRAFCKALNNANKLSVSIVEILQNRAIESRRELDNEIERRIGTLESKVVIVFSLPSAISIMIIAVSPAMWTLSQSL